jgi:hypothetical protein
MLHDESRDEEGDEEISCAMAVVEGDAKGDSIGAMESMSIGMAEELKCGNTAAFSSWCAEFASNEKFSTDISVPGVTQLPSGYTVLYGHKGSDRSTSHNHEQR